MIPYFYNLDSKLFTNDLLKRVEDLALNNIEKFVSYRSQITNDTDGNNYYRIREEFGELNILINNCAIPCFSVIMLHKPNSKVIRHRDDPNKRNSVIITPVSPSDNYTPTRFYENKYDKHSIAQCSFEVGKSVLVNTQELHDLDNLTDNYRINLQLCFDKDFQTVLDLYQKNLLFRS